MESIFEIGGKCNLFRVERYFIYPYCQLAASRFRVSLNFSGNPGSNAYTYLIFYVIPRLSTT